MSDIPFFEAIHDLTHTPDADPLFQESNLVVWHDLETGMGGFWRIGQEANAMTLNSCFGVFTRDGLRFRSNVSAVPMDQKDRSETHMSWGKMLRVDLDTLDFKIDFPECRGVLQFTDFFPRYDYYSILNRPGRNGGALGHHFEVAGEMRGELQIGGKNISVNALGYRDRSWGRRPWNELRGTRWWPAVFGPDLCIHVTGSVHESGSHGCYGYMVRDGHPSPLSEVDVAVMLDYDALGPRSGIASFELKDGGKGKLTHTRSDAIVMHVRGFTAVESIGIAEWEGRRGMSLLEVSTNPAGGNKPPIVVLNANHTDGLSRRP